MAEGDTVELPAVSCTSDDHNVELEPQSDLPLAKVNALSVAELQLGDSREPLSSPPQSDNGITPVPIIPAEEKHVTGDGTDVQVASSMVLPTNIGVRVLLKEIKCLAHRVEFVEAVVEPLKRHDGAPAVDDGTAADAQLSAGRQPAVGMTHELKQSIKESAELIRTINGDFSRLGEKLNEWIPVVDKKSDLTKDIFTTLVTEQEERVKELKQQLHNVQQLLNRRNVEMELKYEEHKKTISELSEELSRKKELETLKKDNEQLDIKIKEHEKMEVKLYHEIKGKSSENERLSTALQEKQVMLQEKQERIKQLEADLNNKIESAKTETEQGLAREQERLLDDNQQQREKIAQLEKNLEAVRLELIEQLKIDKERSKMDKKHQMEQSDLMLNVIQKKILDSSVQEQLIQTVLKINQELAPGLSKDDPVETNIDPERVVPDKPIVDDMLHKK